LLRCDPEAHKIFDHTQTHADASTKSNVRNEVCLDMAMMEINRTHGFNCKDDLDFHSTLKVKVHQLLNSRESISGA